MLHECIDLFKIKLRCGLLQSDEVICVYKLLFEQIIALTAAVAKLQGKTS